MTRKRGGVSVLLFALVVLAVIVGVSFALGYILGKLLL
jgi:uncharacterized protein (UPF0333 family)